MAAQVHVVALITPVPGKEARVSRLRGGGNVVLTLRVDEGSPYKSCE
jgi:hypothetical protein